MYNDNYDQVQCNICTKNNSYISTFFITLQFLVFKLKISHYFSDIYNLYPLI